MLPKTNAFVKTCDGQIKECKCILKKVIRHIDDNLNEFFYSDESGVEYIRMK